jgi:O-antigen/teichoic acid export membrane protein
MPEVNQDQIELRDAALTSVEPDLAADIAPKLSYGRGFAWTFLFNMVTRVSLLFVQLYIANRLGRAPMGIFALLTTIYSLAELMREAGLKQAYFNDPDLTPAKYRTYGRLSLTSGLAFGLIMAALAYPLAWFYNIPDLGWCMMLAALAVAVNGFTVVPSASLLKDGRFRDIGLIETVAAVGAAVIGLLIVLAGYGLLGLMMQLVLRSAIGFVLFQRLRPVEIRDHDREAVKPIMRLCGQLVATDLLWMLYFLTDQLLVPKKFGESNNGVYGSGKRLILAPAEFIFSPLHRTITIAVGHRAGNDKLIGQAFVRSFSVGVLMLLPLYLSLAFFSPAIVQSLLPKFGPAMQLMPILAVAEACRTLTSLGGTPLVASGRARIPMYAWIVPYPVTAAMLALSWQHLTLESVAWAVTAGYASVAVVVIGSAFKLLPATAAEYRKLGKSAICVMVTGAAAYGLSRLPLHHWPLFLTGLVSIPIVHFLAVGMVFAGRPTEYMSLSGIKRLRGTL